MPRFAKINLLFISLTIGLFIASCGTEDPTGEKAATFAANHLEETGIAGLTISVGIDHNIVWSDGFGLADLEQHVPVDPSLTKFRVGSVAKSMTAMALGQLYDAGLLDLDTPIQTYLPDFPEKEAPITTRMLAGHLGGIRHYEDDEFLSAERYSSVSAALEIFQDDPVVVPPGSKFSYSTYGYNLISAIVESAASQDYLSYMSDNVFGPIGMSQTVADRVIPIISNRSRYYVLQDGQLINTPWVDNSNKWAGGGFLSTSDDLVRFGFAHLSDQFLQAGTIEMMWTSQSTLSGEKTNYGIGWSTRTDDQGRKVIGHTGGSVGGTTNLQIYPEEGLVIALITNTSEASLGDITNDVAEVFLTEQ